MNHKIKKERGLLFYVCLFVVCKQLKKEKKGKRIRRKYKERHGNKYNVFGNKHKRIVR